ncbi:MAG: carboxypeptidase regulatory-like domain-containing protein [Planctomycetes bacterium]|nr:carboxypeptidase regulatory-like domain-containing protein [Planctomycetota bacterium]
MRASGKIAARLGLAAALSALIAAFVLLQSDRPDEGLGEGRRDCQPVSSRQEYSHGPEGLERRGPAPSAGIGASGDVDPAGSTDDPGDWATGTVLEAASWRALPAAEVGLVSGEPHEQPSVGLLSTQVLMRAVKTDGEGRFRVCVPPNFAGWIVARAPGFLQAAVDWGEVVEEVTFALHRLGALCGQIVDESTRLPVPGTTVRVSVADAQGRAGVTPPRTSTSGPDGTFVIGQLPVLCDLKVRAFHPDYSDSYLSTRIPCDGLIIALRPGGTITGFVRAAPSLQPVRDAWVEHLSGSPRRARTGADGSYTLEGLPCDGNHFVVRATAEGFPPRTELIANLRSGERREVDFLLPATCSVEGIVVAESGSPIEGASVSLFMPDRKYIVSLASCLTCVTDRAGAYAIRPVPADTIVSLLCFQPGTGRVIRSLRTPAGDDRCRVEPLVLRAGVTLSGRARTTPSDHPLAGARIEAIQMSGGPDVSSDVARDARLSACRTDRSGRFLLESLLPGRHLIIMSAPDGRRWQQMVHLAEDSTVDVLLPDGTDVVGTVRDRSGAAVAGALCVLLPQRGVVVPRTAVSAVDGSFRFPCVEEGVYTLAATSTARGFAPSIETLHVGREPVAYDLLLLEGVSGEGDVRDGEGQPVPNVDVLFFAKEYPQVPPTTGSTDTEGVFNVSGLMPGTRYQIMVISPETSTRLDIVGRSSELLLPREERIEIRVRNQRTTVFPE